MHNSACSAGLKNRFVSLGVFSMFIRNTDVSMSASTSRAKSLSFGVGATTVISALLIGSPAALAQSTGTQAAEETLSEVTVTARKIRDLAGVMQQDAPKSRLSIGKDFLETQTTGQTIFQSINQIPGVNFTNSDPYGNSGGNLRIRGFDGSRVSVTFDGIPLNDSGNYALFTNQMLDEELVDRVDVNLGTTDVDSPTASATGGTVAYRSLKPTAEMSGKAVVSGGEFSYRRAFGLFETGAFGPTGTRAWFAASKTQYDKFKGPGSLNKTQFNAKIYQDWDNGNFISLAAHWNRNRNAFYRTTSAANYLLFGRGYENLATCTRVTPTAGVADNEGATPVASTPTLLNTDNPLNPGSCTNFYGVRINPSDTGNLRGQSLVNITDKLRWTFDPSLQYVLANGGGTNTIAETPSATAADKRVIGASTATGIDLNGDGDKLDTIRFYTPNNTNTYRLGINSSLIWDLSAAQRFRIAYSLDRARHRQTGEWGLMGADGQPQNVFGGLKGTKVFAADGSVLRGRDRYSIAQLNQFSGEWRGKFLDSKLTATIGLRATYFKRELNQYCYSQNQTANVLCTTQTPVTVLANGNVRFAPGATTTAANPEYIPPYSDSVKFNKLLPSLGLTYEFASHQSIYVSYAEGLSAPRTDNLYAVSRLTGSNTIFRSLPESEATKAYDLGWRYNTETTLASIALYHIDYQNRIVSAFDPIQGFNVDRNVGSVKTDGVDAQVGFRFNDELTVSSNASYNRSILQDNIPGGQQDIRGKQLVETPHWTLGARADFRPLDRLHIGLQGKYVGDRFGTDNNNEIAPHYTVVDVDARYEFDAPKLKSLQLKFNLTNVFNEGYFGNISSGTGATASAVAFYQIGAPRTVQVSLEAAF